MMLQANNRGARIMQPPGGASSFALNDGSTRRAAPPVVQERYKTHQGNIQPPGGRSSFAFDDYAGQVDEGVGRAVPRQQRKLELNAPGGPSCFSLNDASTAVMEDPTQPRLKSNVFNQPPGGRATFAFGESAPMQQRQGDRARAHPPGGRSSLSLHDGDSLSGFMAEQRPAVRVLTREGEAKAAIPAQDAGGRSSFSVGWGSDDYCNHHYAALGKAPPVMGQQRPKEYAPQAHQQHQHQPPVYASAMVGGNDFSHGALPSHISSNAYANGASQNTGNVITGRSSTRVVAPPGGRSSIQFG